MEGRVRSGKSCWSRLGSECNICESLTAGPCHVINITREAICEGADAIIAVGGDRTLHEGRKRRTTLFHKCRQCSFECQGWSSCIKIQTFGNLCYVIRALQAFFGHNNQDLRIKVDDGDWEVYSQVTALCIGNAKCGGMKISQNADSSSGTFESMFN